MRVLIGTDNFYPNVNGAARFTEELAKGLVKKGHNVDVIAPSSKFKNTISNYHGVNVYGIPSVMIPTIIHPAKLRIPFIVGPSLVENIMRKLKPEIVHIQDHFMIGNSTINAARKLSLPVIGTNHFMPDNLIHYIDPFSIMKKPLLRLAWKQFISIYKNLDLITTPTQTAADLLKDLGLEKPVIPISCGVDLNRFNPKNNGNYLRSRFKIDQQKLVILSVGRLDKEKSADLIVKAFAEVLQSVSAHLVIAGQGKEKSGLIKQAKQLGISQNVTFTGLIPNKDLPFLYCIADLFVIASIAELQSIVTMEAMASGLPVVSVNAMALPELVHHGKNGYLFPRGNINTFAKQITKVLKDPLLRKRMSQNSLEIIRSHNLEKTIKEYEEIYFKLSKQTLARLPKTHFSTSEADVDDSLAKKLQADNLDCAIFSTR